MITNSRTSRTSRTVIANTPIANAITSILMAAIVILMPLSSGVSVSMGNSLDMIEHMNTADSSSGSNGNEHAMNMDVANMSMASMDVANMNMASMDVANMNMASMNMASMDMASMNMANMDMANVMACMDHCFAFGSAFVLIAPPSTNNSPEYQSLGSKIPYTELPLLNVFLDQNIPPPKNLLFS